MRARLPMSRSPRVRILVNLVTLPSQRSGRTDGGARARCRSRTGIPSQISTRGPE